MAAEVNKPDFSFQWASGGSIVAPSDVKIQTGWTAEVPPFQWENFLQNRQDNAILHLFQKGVSEWDSASNYYFTTSGVRSYVQGSNGQIYVAVQDSVGQNPTTDTTRTYWKPFLSTVEGIQGSNLNLRGSATGTSAIVTVTADLITLTSTLGEQKVLSSVSVSPSLASSGVNGLDTGVSAINTWYYVWLIWNGATTAGLISLSSTAPTMPVGYTHKARVSEFRTDATANKYPLNFLQSGKNFTWVLGNNLTNNPVLATGVSGSIAGSPAGWTAIPVGSAVPPTAHSIHIFLGSTSGSDGTAIVAPNALYGGVAGNPTPVLAVSAGATQPGCIAARIMLESTNVYYACNGAAFVFKCTGWESYL
jgi:hypothetical protein